MIFPWKISERKKNYILAIQNQFSSQSAIVLEVIITMIWVFFPTDPPHCVSSFYGIFVFNIFCQTLITIITKSNDGGVVPDYVMLCYMPWINYFHSNGPCVNYLISGSNPNPWGATAILMCKIGGAYEFSACHSSMKYTILKNFQLSSW